MAPKSFVETRLIIVLVVAAPAAEAQLQGIICAILNLVQIQGISSLQPEHQCSNEWNSNACFPKVQPTCGVRNIIATATTNVAGIFLIVLNTVQFLLSEVLSNCRLVVPTPLSNCNPALPAVGVLQLALQFARSFLIGLFNIADIIPAGF